MLAQSVTGTILLIITGLTTYSGLKHTAYQDKYRFDVDAILIGKEYYRLLSSGFLHANWLHFAFNMGAMLSFSLCLEATFGLARFLPIYFVAMLGGSLFALYIHRNTGTTGPSAHRVR